MNPENVFDKQALLLGIHDPDREVRMDALEKIGDAGDRER